MLQRRPRWLPGFGQSEAACDDVALMELVALGQEAALRSLMQRHGARVLRLAEGILQNRAEADDVAQEAFLRVWRHAAAFDPGQARFTTWLHRIATNLALDRVRQPVSDPIESAEEVPDGSADILAELLATERRVLVQRAMAGLPERQRTALALFHFEEASGRDAAAAMALTEKAFESLLTRARSALRARVASLIETDRGKR